MFSVVPPAAVTQGSPEGNEIVGVEEYCVQAEAPSSYVTQSVAPLSPVLPKNVTPSVVVAVWKNASNCATSARPAALFSDTSEAAQLCEMTLPRWWLTAYCSSWRNWGRPCTPSVSSTGLVSTVIPASGAMAWTVSASSVVSPCQPDISLLLGS